ncbi:acetolactate synthase large subunit [Labrenzia sp. R4_1]|uniref:acetolactate synthase large subunit n=1 Tax=Labrenzia sp. R4_1 TaxID=2821106 RepID=UPI001ADADBEB|nr:acetolactate synthase large subunit [Labrenzia sp. R4_1]MBO9423816.1 acetolactate synthase large subunit [Labrenzia sp. R4_1]
MNGAEALVKTMLASDVSVCFANPGTSEMHFVAALDTHPDMRCILCLFEGGVTGAADGYARMSGNVAGTLLHLGPGFGNGWANLHNARKGHSGIVNIVGDHAGYHLKHDAPLQADLDGVAGSVSHWVRRATDSTMVASAGAEAIRVARGGEIATVILQADCAWGDSQTGPTKAQPPAPKHRPDKDRVVAAAKALSEPGAALLVSGAGLYGEGAELAGKIAAKTGCRLLSPFFAPRIALGEGAVAFESLPYNADLTAEFLAGQTRIVLVGEDPPVNFFAYPGKPSTPEPAGCALDRLCYGDWDVLWTLETLAEAAGVDGSETIARVKRHVPDIEPSALTAEGIGRGLANAIPEGAIMVNEAVTAGAGIWPFVNVAAAHDRINNTGGSIGQCLPNALGASVACPDRPVFAVSGDGSAMYQVQSLWTAAREELDITVVIVANRGYQILHFELEAQGAPKPGRNASAMFDIENPLLDWVALAAGHGVPGVRVDSEEGLAEALKTASNTKGPFLIEAVI